MDLQLEKRFEIVNHIFSIFVIILSGLLAFYYIAEGNTYRFILSVFSPLFLCVPKVCNKVLGLQAVQRLNFLAYCYCFLTYTIGMCFAAYQTSDYYDKIMHTLSGFVFSMVGLLLFYYMNPHKEISKEDFGIVAVFVTSFSMAVALLWEIYEYLLFIIADIDAQNMYTTGVHDTMQDSLVCLLGAILFLIPLGRYFKRGKTGVVMGAFSYFHKLNTKKTSHTTPI